MYHPQHLNLSNVIPNVEFEGIANGHSMHLYNIPEVQSIIRRSFRYKVLLLLI